MGENNSSGKDADLKPCRVILIGKVVLVAIYSMADAGKRVVRLGRKNETIGA